MLPLPTPSLILRQRLRWGIVKKMRVGQVNILENSNRVETYGEKSQTFSSMSLPTMFMFLPFVFTVCDTFWKPDLCTFLVINSVDINLVIQPTVFGGGQKDKEEKETPESFKRAKGSTGSLMIISGQWIDTSPQRELCVAITEEQIVFCLHSQKQGSHLSPLLSICGGIQEDCLAFLYDLVNNMMGPWQMLFFEHRCGLVTQMRAECFILVESTKLNNMFSRFRQMLT